MKEHSSPFLSRFVARESDWTALIFHCKKCSWIKKKETYNCSYRREQKLCLFPCPRIAPGDVLVRMVVCINNCSFLAVECKLCWRAGNRPLCKAEARVRERWREAAGRKFTFIFSNLESFSSVFDIFNYADVEPIPRTKEVRITG